MFSIRQVLRLGLRLTYAQYSAQQYYAPTLYKLFGINAFHQERLVHHDVTDNRKELNKLEGKMKLLFTCKKCNTRNSKLISKLAYNKGVIIVRCDGCKNNHLIADNLGWFKDIHNGINIERLMASQGETVRKITNDMEGYFEIVANEEFNLHRKRFGVMEDSDNVESTTKIDKIEASKES